MGDTFTADRATWLEQVAADSGDLPALATPVAIFIARYVNRDSGDAWPSLATLCAHLRKAERTVQRALRALADRGHLIIEAGGGRRNTNRYRWVLKPAENPVQDDTLSGENPDEDDTVSAGETPSFSVETPSFLVKNPDQNDTRTSEEPSREPLKERIPLACPR